MAQDREIKGKTTEANKLREQNNEAQLRIKELEHNINKHKKDSADAAARVGVRTGLSALRFLGNGIGAFLAATFVGQH